MCALDFVAGDEVYGACTKLRTFLEEHGRAYVLRIRALAEHEKTQRPPTPSNRPAPITPP